MMKSDQWVAVGILAVGVCASAVGGTTGVVVAPRKDLMTWNDLSRLSIGGSYQVQQREVHGVFGRNSEIEVRASTAHVGLDLTPWLTISGSGGWTRLEPENMPRDEDMHEMWGAGLSARLFSHQIEGPELLRGRFGLLTDFYFYEYGAYEDEDELEWDEWVATAKFRYELFAFDDGEGDRTLPFSTVVTLGPIYSDITGDLEARHLWGILTGVSAFITPEISLSWELQYYEQPTHTLSLGYHF